ncbi:hypothetical protein HN51_012370, partial [Arachis hypogaea]
RKNSLRLLRLPALARSLRMGYLMRAPRVEVGTRSTDASMGTAYAQSNANKSKKNK